MAHLEVRRSEANSANVGEKRRVQTLHLTSDSRAHHANSYMGRAVHTSPSCYADGEGRSVVSFSSNHLIGICRLTEKPLHDADRLRLRPKTLCALGLSSFLHQACCSRSLPMPHRRPKPRRMRKHCIIAAEGRDNAKTVGVAAKENA